MPFLIYSSNIPCECVLRDFLISDIVLSFLGRPLLLTHCRCTGVCCNWSHTMTHTHMVGLLWKRDRLVAEPSISQNTTFTADRHISTSAGFKSANPGSKRPRTDRLPWIGLSDIRFYKLQMQIYYMGKLAHLKRKAPQRSALYVQLEIIFIYIS